MISRGILSVWLNWVMSVGIICLLVGLSPLVSPEIVPFLSILFVLFLMYLSNQNPDNHSLQACYRLTYVIKVTMLISTFFIIGFYFYLWYFGMPEITGKPSNPDSPQIPILVIAPISVAVSIYYLLRGSRSSYCISCMRLNSTHIDNGFLGYLYKRESDYQLKFFLILSLLLTIAGWVYYLFFYVNVSITRADNYVFVIIPLAFYAISVVYLGVRYYGMKLYYASDDRTARYLSRSGTTVRYLIICDDRMLLANPSNNVDPLSSDDFKIDTPLKYSFSYRENFTLAEATDAFRNASGLKDATVKKLYESLDPNMFQNSFYFAVYLPDAEKEKAAETLNGEWVTLYEYNKMVEHGMIASVLAAEISRIYTIALAWKTYDRRGRRLYKVKHYRPTFRLKDMIKWDVDYNDSSWIYVSTVNQDTPFYRLRRLWIKLMCTHS